MNKRTPQSGFTVVELMIALLVGAILMAVAVPSFMDLIRNNRMATAANNFIGDLNLARSEAIKRSRNVFITAANPGAGNEFGGGWTVWADSDGDGVMDPGEEIRITPAIRAEMTLDSVGNINQIQYQRDGTLNAVAGQDFDLCDDRSGETGRRISIAGVGRVSLDDDLVCP